MLPRVRGFSWNMQQFWKSDFSREILKKCMFQRWFLVCAVKHEKAHPYLSILRPCLHQACSVSQFEHRTRKHTSLRSLRIAWQLNQLDIDRGVQNSRSRAYVMSLKTTYKQTNIALDLYFIIIIYKVVSGMTYGMAVPAWASSQSSRGWTAAVRAFEPTGEQTEHPSALHMGLVSMAGIAGSNSQAWGPNYAWPLQVFQWGAPLSPVQGSHLQSNWRVLVTCGWIIMSCYQHNKSPK